MEQQIESLWPKQIEEFAPIRTPGTVLREQAAALTKQLNGVVTAKVELTTDTNQRVVSRLILNAPALNYRYELLSVQYSVAPIYPAVINLGGSYIHCSNEGAFKEGLKNIFANEKTVNIIHSLVSQSIEVTQKNPSLTANA